MTKFFVFFHDFCRFCQRRFLAIGVSDVVIFADFGLFTEGFSRLGFMPAVDRLLIIWILSLVRCSAATDWCECDRYSVDGETCMKDEECKCGGYGIFFVPLQG